MPPRWKWRKPHGALIVAFLAALAAAPASAPTQAQTPAQQGQQPEAKLPRFATLRSAEVNVRTGPGVRYPVDWVLMRKNMPVEVTAEFETWRKIRDWQGTEGWVHQSNLNPRRGVIVIGEVRPIRRSAEVNAAALARAEPGTIGSLLECKPGWCRVEIGGHRGWVRADEIWGVGPNDTGK